MPDFAWAIVFTAIGVYVAGIITGSAHTFKEYRRLWKFEDAARYILSQSGDDICWRDVYIKLGECLRQGDPLRETAAAKTTPPPAIFLRNCARFCKSLYDGKPYIRFNDNPLETRDARLDPIIAASALVRVSRKVGAALPWEEYRAVTAVMPTGYASHERVQLALHEMLNGCLEEMDAKERKPGQTSDVPASSPGHGKIHVINGCLEEGGKQI